MNEYFYSLKMATQLNYAEFKASLTLECVPLLLEGLKCSTRCTVSAAAWFGYETGYDFVARVCDHSPDKLIYIKMTNDQRRKLMPVLRYIAKVQNL